MWNQKESPLVIGGDRFAAWLVKKNSSACPDYVPRSTRHLALSNSVAVIFRYKQLIANIPFEEGICHIK
jgi:hypothetical protein